MKVPSEAKRHRAFVKSQALSVKDLETRAEHVMEEISVRRLIFKATKEELKIERRVLADAKKTLARLETEESLELCAGIVWSKGKRQGK